MSIYYNIYEIFWAFLLFFGSVFFWESFLVVYVTMLIKTKSCKFDIEIW